MPRELIAPAREELEYRPYDTPSPGPGEVRVKSRFGAAKHGSEMAIYQGYAAPRGGYDPELGIFTQDRQMVRYPALVGNMCVGEVVETGAGVEGVEVGETVFAHGGFREEHVWPVERLRKLSPDVPWQAAVCLDPADFALGAVRDGHVRLGDGVAIFGMGAIGLFALQFARLAGAYPLIAVDPIEKRRRLALECGADIVLDPSACDAGLEIRKATSKRGADVCIEYSGNVRALQAALRGVAYLGTVVAGAWPGAYPAGLDLGAEAHFNRPSIVFSRACSEPGSDYPRWNEDRLFDTAWRLLSSGALECKAIIEPIVSFDEVIDNYPRILSAPEESIKLGIRFENN